MLRVGFGEGLQHPSSQSGGVQRAGVLRDWLLIDHKVHQEEQSAPQGLQVSCRVIASMHLVSSVDHGSRGITEFKQQAILDHNPSHCPTKGLVS